MMVMMKVKQKIKPQVSSFYSLKLPTLFEGAITTNNAAKLQQFLSPKLLPFQYHPQNTYISKLTIVHFMTDAATRRHFCWLCALASEYLWRVYAIKESKYLRNANITFRYAQ